MPFLTELVARHHRNVKVFEKYLRPLGYTRQFPSFVRLADKPLKGREYIEGALRIEAGDPIHAVQA